MELSRTPFTGRSTATDVLAGVRLDGQRMIVTGGASGLGLETVRALSAAGAEVTVATRNPAGAAALVTELPGVDIKELDVADPASVRRFVTRWEGPVHALVANAGVMAVPTRQLNPAGWELQLATNFLGHFQLANGLHENLRAAGPARVVVVSSGVQLRSPVDLDDLHFERRLRPADRLRAVQDRRGAPRRRHQPAPGGRGDHRERPLVQGVTGRYFEDNQESEVVPGGSGARSGVAE